MVDPQDSGSLRSFFGTRPSITPDMLVDTIAELKEMRRQLVEAREMLGQVRKRENLKWKIAKVNRDKYG